jgi:hypothetical protein
MAKLGVASVAALARLAFEAEIEFVGRRAGER